MNNHVNPHLMDALAPFAPPPAHQFSVAVRHLKGERGCVLAAADRQSASIKATEVIALRPDETPTGGYEIRIVDLGAAS